MERKIDVALRPFDEFIRAEYRAMFPGAPDKSAELLEWRFLANPHGTARFSVASDGERPIGMIALLPTRLRNVAGECLGYQAIDTFVDPACRGQGLFVKMGSLAQDSSAHGAGVLWGFPNANAAPGWYGRLGWTDFGPVPLLMRPLRARFLLRRVYPKLKAMDWPLLRLRSCPSHHYDDGAQLAADFDRLWNRVVARFGVAVDRSGQWMRWRLFDKPGADYRCVGMKSPEGELETFVSTKVHDKHGGRLCYVMEAIGDSERPRALARLLLAELALAARSGAEVALAWCPKSAPNYAAYRKAGFLPVPARFRPIEINFGARPLRPDCAAAAAPGARWYVSYLDSDTN